MSSQQVEGLLLHPTTTPSPACAAVWVLETSLAAPKSQILAVQFLSSKILGDFCRGNKHIPVWWQPAECHCYGMQGLRDENRDETLCHACVSRWSCAKHDRYTSLHEPHTGLPEVC